MTTSTTEMPKLRLGDWVSCSSYIRQSGNHFEIDNEDTGTALLWRKDATEGEEIEDYESCEKFVTKTALFTGVFVGVTWLCTELFCEWNDPPYTMAWAFAETRERLRMYEETRLSPMDLKDRLIAPFQNDMFAMVWGAFKKLYPDKECEIYWEPQIRDEEDDKPVYGLTDFADDGSVAVFVKPSLEVADAVEILAHELAHVAVGIEHDHDEVWQEAFDKIFEEYNRIGNQMFPNGEQCVMDDPDEK